MAEAIPDIKVNIGNLTWEEMENLINTSFDDLVRKVNERRRFVLNAMKERKANLNEPISKSIINVKKSRDFLLEQLTDNLTQDLQEDTVRKLSERLSALELDCSKATDLMFVCDAKEFDRAVSVLGSIELIPKQYLSKGEPKFAFGKGDGVDLIFHSASIDVTSGIIAVTELNTQQVYLFSLDGTSLNTFGAGHLKRPLAIKIINHNEILVSDWDLNCILRFKFDPSNCGRGEVQLLSTTKFITENVICIEYDTASNLMYATLILNDVLISFHFEDLEANTIYDKFISPSSIHLTENDIFVMDAGNPCLHVISKSTHQLTRSLIPCGMGLHLSGVHYFTLDEDMNVIIADYWNHNIRIYSPTGHLLHTLSREGRARGELNEPSSIHIDDEMNIYIVSRNMNFPIHIF